MWNQRGYHQQTSYTDADAENTHTRGRSFSSVQKSPVYPCSSHVPSQPCRFSCTPNPISAPASVGEVKILYYSARRPTYGPGRAEVYTPNPYPASQPAKPCTALERFSATLCSAARRHSSVLSAQDITFPLPRTGVGPTSQCEGAWELWSGTGKKISQDAERAGGIYNGSHFSPSLPPQPDLPARLRAPDDESCCSQSPSRSPPRSAATQSPPRQIPPPRSVARAGQKTWATVVVGCRRSRWRVSRTWSLAWRRRRRPSSASTPTLVRGIIFLWFTDLCSRSLPVCADCVSYLPLHAFIFNHRILPVSAIPRNTRARFVCVCFGRSISNSESSQNPRSNMPWWKRMFGCFSGNNTNCTIISCTLHRPGARRWFPWQLPKEREWKKAS
jgi:hypothetical protein